ncbi:hypothetical protein D9757_010001 [Collybiopsis confluens]|uniref:non-specific serine/threonine protein kinase n=1 Tax=Collybiopsis confluens TaxID=2823264 RepID=A0A8H5GUQ8_9AGAR|nr:hypothetical protein D9757_010001 [Collybiopsis confluens]
MNYCYYATHSHHVRLEHDYSESSGSDAETASNPSSSSSSTTSTTPSSSSPKSNPVPRRMTLVDLDLIKLINTGGSGKVYLVRDKVDRQHLALKVIPKSRNIFTSNKEKVTEEKNIHSCLTMESDDFFLPLVATWSDADNFYLASEYVPGGDLALRIMQQRTFEEAESKFYIAELVVALERLHARKIIHRDIKPSNILIRPDGHIVLADFGVSKRFFSFEDVSDESFYTDRDSSDDSSSSDSSEDSMAVVEACRQLGINIVSSSPYDSASSDCCYMTSDDCGTPYFMSPEQHRGDKYSFEVDYWATGVILYRMLTGKMPFGDCAMNKGQIARSVLEDDVNFFGDSSKVSLVAQDFIQSLLAKDPCHRIHPSEIRKHPFFYGIDWSLVENRELRAPWLPYVPPMPKLSRGIFFAGYRDLVPGSPAAFYHHPSADVDGTTCSNDELSLSSFTWYSPYARLNRVRTLHQHPTPPLSPSPSSPPSPQAYERTRTKVISAAGGDIRPGPSNVPNSLLSIDAKWKSWFRSVFCSSGIGAVGRGKNNNIGRRRIRGWYHAVV